MPSFINLTMRKIWKKMARKNYRDGYVSAHISNTVASQITKLRSENGWTQAELAERAGMKQSRISALEDPNWENVEVATLKRLASAYDVGLTVRFVPYSELAQWAVTLSEDKLHVPTYEEEAADRIPDVATTGAAAAFFKPLEQPHHRSVYDDDRWNDIFLPPLPKNGLGASALAARVPSSNDFGPRQ
jgi:transcriptional regulator with XRE-family HTH domain